MDAVYIKMFKNIKTLDMEKEKVFWPAAVSEQKWCINKCPKAGVSSSNELRATANTVISCQGHISVQ